MVYGANRNKNLVINNYHRSTFKIVYNILLLSVTTKLIYELSCSILLQKVNQKERRIHSISKKSPRGTVSTPPFIPPFFGGLAVDQRALGSTAPKYRCVANTLLYCTVLVREWFLILYGDEGRGDFRF
ncbi:MAG: hypothetical protein ACI90V_009697 [Bacillariaceae sp.]|jgi:hypothetical protein